MAMNFGLEYHLNRVYGDYNLDKSNGDVGWPVGFPWAVAFLSG